MSAKALLASCTAPGYVRFATESIIEISTGDVVSDFFSRSTTTNLPFELILSFGTKLSTLSPFTAKISLLSYFRFAIPVLISLAFFIASVALPACVSAKEIDE